MLLPFSEKIKLYLDYINQVRRWEKELAKNSSLNVEISISNNKNEIKKKIKN